LDPSVDRPNVAGKVVVVGVTAPGVGETFLTPSGTQESSPAIQTEVIESVFANDTLWRPFWAEPVERATALLLGLAGGLLVGRVRYNLRSLCDRCSGNPVNGGEKFPRIVGQKFPTSF
jgi:CHASE2 domain-containing sensor protein